MKLDEIGPVKANSAMTATHGFPTR